MILCHQEAKWVPCLEKAEVRVLGCLVEKEATTPDNYPLTLNSLRNACNQATSAGRSKFKRFTLSDMLCTLFPARWSAALRVNSG